MKVRAVGKSDRGRVRTENEDVLVIDEQHGLFAVVDGFGGHPGATDAAARGAATTHEFVSASRQGRVPRAPFPLDLRISAEANRLTMAVRLANRAVYDAHRAQGGTAGATIAALLVTENEAIVVHAGDARVYRHRAGTLTPLTDDHTRAGRMMAAGELARDDARFHPDKKGLTLALGLDIDLTPAVSIVDVAAGDRFLICSDGLTDLVAESRLSSTLSGLGTAVDRARLERAVSVLIEAANQAGGDDNVTVLIVDVA